MELKRLDGTIILPNQPTQRVNGHGWVEYVPPRGARETVLQALKERLDLRYCDFRGLFLSGLTFSGLDLSGASFSHTVLESVHFDGCNLTHCDFSHANLFRADFSQAVIDGCNFDSANLFGAFLDVLSFTGANFENARLDGARLNEALRAHLEKIARERALREYLLGDAPLDPELVEALRRKLEVGRRK